MTPQQKRAIEIVAGMEPWWRDIGAKKRKPSRDGRTAEQCDFDSGVFAASELIRRYTSNEELSLAMHELCFWARKERLKGNVGKSLCGKD